MLQAEDVQGVFENALPEALLRPLIDAAQFQQRDRKLDPVTFIRAMIIAAATQFGGVQAGIMRVYFEMGAKRVVRGGFYRWFCPALESVMEAVSNHVCAQADSEVVDLPGWLGQYVKDWHIFDSTTVRLDDALIDEYPGAGNYAALKVHKRFSVGVGTTVSYTISPARDHDSKHLHIDESWRGLGLLADLGYASFERLRECERYGVSYVIRLKDNWKPKVKHLARGKLKRALLPNADFDAVIENDLDLDGTVIDMDVELGTGKSAVTCRLVGVPSPTAGYRFYLSNLSPAVGPHQVADLYRVRWEIEADNKLDKSCLRLEEIGSRTAPVVRAMIHAAMTSSMIICLLAHKERIKNAPPRGAKVTERTQAPIHPQTLARAVGSAAKTIAEAFTAQGADAHKSWQFLAGLLDHLGKDPNWRRRPSILDQLRGWKVSPGRVKTARLSSRAA